MPLAATHQCKDVRRAVCFHCFRAARERQRTGELAQAGRQAAEDRAEEPCAGGSESVVGRRFESASLDARQIAHRRAMLETLRAQRAAADN